MFGAGEENIVINGKNGSDNYTLDMYCHIVDYRPVGGICPRIFKGVG